MTDYNQTRDIAGIITSRFADMLKNLQDDYEEEIVVVTLMKYYNVCSGPRGDADEDLLWAIGRVLQDLMTTYAFDRWVATRAYPKKEK